MKHNLDYGIAFEGKVYTPNGTDVSTKEENEARNQEIERQDLDIWSCKPERWAAYASHPENPLDYGHVTTWPGTRIGVITSSRTSRTGFYGTKIRRIWVRGSNGARYYGSYGPDWSDLVRLRKLKTKK